MASLALHGLGLLSIMLWPGISSIPETPQTIQVEMLSAPQPTETPSVASPVAEAAKSAQHRPIPFSVQERPKSAIKPQAVPVAPSPSMEGAPQSLAGEDVLQAKSAAGGNSSSVAQDTAPDHRAAYLSNPKPTYPFSARKRGIEGRVTLKVVVDQTGGVTSLSVLNSSGHAGLDDAAVEAVRHWRFVPARRRGEAASGEAIVPIDFRLSAS